MFEKNKMIAAVRDEFIFKTALDSKCEVIFLLSSNIINITDMIKAAHDNHKRLYLHMDFADGIGKDEYGVRYLEQLKVDGIISTRAGIIKAAKSRGIPTVQRFFILDSQSVKTALETISSAHPDMVEIMPGVIPKIIASLKQKISTPLIAGGLIDSSLEVKEALSAGASAVSTGKTTLWGGI